jgi:hypothetical protein
VAGFAFAPMLANLETMVQQLPTVQAVQAAVYVGVPEAFEARINAFITLGSATPGDGFMGGRTREPRLIVSFGYVVGADERGAELAIAELIDELTASINNDPTLGGTSDDPVTLDMSRADTPEYQGRAGSEARIYPIVVIGHQQQMDS